MDTALTIIGSLTDDELDSRLVRLALGERQVLVVFLVHLAEFEARKSHEPRSFPSLFEYCTRRLGLSEAEAYLRIRAARIVRESPQALSMLAAGEIGLSTLARLSPHLTPANTQALLTRACGKTRREVERIALEFELISPQMDIIRALPPPGSMASSPDPHVVDDPQLDFPGLEPPPCLEAPDGVPRDADRQAARRGISQDGLVRISFTATERLVAAIERSRALLRHKHPDGRLEHIFGEAVECLLDAWDPQRRLERKARRNRRRQERRRSAASETSRLIPQHVRDEVWARDEGRCSFISSDGQRCGSTDWLEYDHILPWALGGPSDDASNIRLLCRAHNQHSARRIFGAAPKNCVRRQADR